MGILKFIPLEERIVLDAAAAAVFHVTNNHDSGAGSLRDAVTQANAHPGTDTIVFNSNVTSVNLLNPLVITGSVTLDGANAAAIGGKVALTGAGIDLAASNSILKNLNISTNTTNGIGVLVEGSYNTLLSDVLSGNYKGVDETGGWNTYQNDYVGTNITGMTAVGNSYGLFLEGSGHDTITGSVISGNHTDFNAAPIITDPADAHTAIYGGGIWIATSMAGNNTISNNHLGTSVTGTTVIENGADILSFAGNNLITQNQIGGSHVISLDLPNQSYFGNREIMIMPGADSNMISNNLFDGYKTSSGQYVQLPNGADAINLRSNHNTVQNNVLLGSIYGAGVAITIFGSSASPTDNLVQNNFIGQDPQGNGINGGVQHSGIFAGTDTHSLILNNSIFINSTGNEVGTANGIFNLTSLNDLVQGNTLTGTPGALGIAGSVGILDLFSTNDRDVGNRVYTVQGITLAFSTNQVVSNNLFSGNSVSVQDAFSTNSQYFNNVFVNPVYTPYIAFFGPSTEANGIIFTGSASPILSNNVMTNSSLSNPNMGPAILSQFTSGISLTNNVISNFPVGLSLQSGSSATSLNDVFKGNVVGIQLDSGNQLTMKNGVITGLGKTSATTNYGVQLTGTNNVVSISNSVLSNATYGFYGDGSLGASNQITLTSNSFFKDHVGINDPSGTGATYLLSNNSFLLDDLAMNF